MCANPKRAGAIELEWVEHLDAVAWLRRSVWGYGLVNGLHILGLAVLVGSVVNVDLRLIGIWRGDRWREGMRDILPITRAGFVLAVLTGLMLFSVKATRYSDNSVFLLKMGLLTAALVNVVLFYRVFRREDRTIAMRLSAATSLTLWIAILGIGRAIGFV